MNKLWYFILGAICLPLLISAGMNFNRSQQELPVLGQNKYAPNPDEVHTIQEFEFTNQLGEVFSTKDIENKIVVANFFFSTCLTVCPVMTRNLQAVQTEFLNDDEVVLISHTVDPETDTPEKLNEYGELFSIDEHKWNLVTGNKKDIYILARNSYQVVATDGDGGPNDFIHSENIMLVDTKKRLRGYYDGTEKSSIDQLIRDINKLKKELNS